MFSIVASRARSRGAREARTVRLSETIEEVDEHGAVSADRFFASPSPQAGHRMRPPEAWPDELFARAETVAAVRVAIDHLSGLRRQVITLR